MEIPPELQRDLKFVFVEKVDDVLLTALKPLAAPRRMALADRRKKSA